MPKVFIHGVPDTHRVWERVREHLPTSDVVALDLPGFDSPVPEDFTATKEEYVDWIVNQLEQFSEPVDLVGHDWGCILTVRVTALRPDLVRTWAAGDGPLNKDYEWHELAKIWQTPVVGEQFMANLDVEEFSETLEQNGVPADLAKDVLGRMDATMKDCILRLYRSAINVGAEWQDSLANITVSPGLVFWGQSDQPCPVEFANRLAEDAKASRTLKLDCGHWTPIERPQEIAQALWEHWDAADQR